MPSNTVDERIVEMRIDNKNFESGAKTTISTLEKLDKALNLKNNASALDDVSKALNSFDASGMTGSLEKVKMSFSALEVAGMRVISNLTDSVYNFTARTIKGLTIDQVTEGWGKYEEKTASVQTIMNATGASIDEVNGYLETLMWYSDETSFGFTDMTSALGQMTSSGGKVENLIPLLMGVGNAVAYAGKGASEFSRVVYNLNQSYGSGFLNYQDWRSLELAGVASSQLKQTFIDVGESLGKIEKGQVTVANFSQTLKDKWADTEVMEKAFGYFAEMSVKARELVENGDFATATEAYEYLASQYDEIQSKAAKAAQEAKSFKEVIDATKDAVSSGWLTTFENIFGNYEEAKVFWSDMAESFYRIFAAPSEGRNTMLETAFGGGTKSLVKTVKSTASGWEKLQSVVEDSGHTMHDFEVALNKVIKESGEYSSADIADITRDIQESFRNGAISADIFHKALAFLRGETEETEETIAEEAEQMSGSLDEFKEVALGVLRGDYGNGHERKEALEALGYDYEMIQWMAGNMRWGITDDDTLMRLMQMYRPQFLEKIKKAASETKEETDDLYESITTGTEEVVEEVEEDLSEVKGRELFTGGVMNILYSLEDVLGRVGAAFEKVFGTAKQRGDKLHKVLELFYKFTKRISLSEDALNGLQKVLQGVFSVFKTAGTILAIPLKIVGSVFMAFKGIIDDVLAMIGRGEFSIKGVFESIKKHVKGLIPTTEQLTNLYQKAKTKLKSLIPTEEQILNFWQNIKNLGKTGFKSIKDFFSTLTLDDIKSKLPTLDKIKEFFHGIGDYLKENYPTITAWFENLKNTSILGPIFEKVSRAFSKIGPQIKNLSFGADGLGGIFGKISQFFSNVLQSLNINGLTGAFEAIGNIFSSIFSFILGDPEELKTNISTAFSTLIETIKEEAKKIKLADIFQGLKLGALIYFISRISQVLNGVRDIGKEIQGIPQAISKVIGDFGDVLKSFTLKNKADAYLKIAAAIGVLAAALIGLSFVPSDKLIEVAMVLGLLIAVIGHFTKNLSGAMDSLESIGSNNNFARIKLNVFNGLGATLLGLGVALIGIGVAISKIAEIPVTNIVKAGITIAAILAVLTTMSAAMTLINHKFDKGGNGALKGAASMALMVLAIRMIIKPLTSLSELSDSGADLNKVVGTLAKISLIMAGMTVLFSFLDALNFEKLHNSSTSAMKGAVAMMLLAVALTMIMLPIKILANLMATIEDLNSAITTLGLMAAALMGIVVILSFINGGSALKAAAAMILVAVAIDILLVGIMIFAGAMLLLATAIPWESLTDKITALSGCLKTLGGLAIVLILFGVAALLFGFAIAKVAQAVLTGSIGLLVFAVALIVLAASIGVITAVFPAFIESLASVGETVKNNWKDILLGAVAFILFAGAMVLLSIALNKLSESDIGTKFAKMIGNIAKGLGAMVSGLGTKLMDALPGLLTVVGVIVLMIGLHVIELIPRLTNMLVKGLITLIQSIADSLRANKDLLLSAVFDLIEVVLETALDALIFGIGTGMALIADYIGARIAEFLRTVATFLSHLPFKKAKDWANDMEGWADEIETIGDTVQEHTVDVMDEVDQKLQERFTFPKPEGADEFVDIFDGVDSGVSAEMEELKKEAQSGLEDVTEVFDKPPEIETPLIELDAEDVVDVEGGDDEGFDLGFDTSSIASEVVAQLATGGVDGSEIGDKFFGGFLGALGSHDGEAEEAGGNVLGSFLGGISGKLEDVTGTITELFGNITGQMDEQAPEMQAEGEAAREFFDLGFTGGNSEGEDDAASGIVGGLMAQFKDLIPDFTGVGADARSNFDAGMLTGAEGSENTAVSTLMSGITGEMETFMPDIGAEGALLDQNLASGITDNSGGVTTAANEVGSNATGVLDIFTGRWKAAGNNWSIGGIAGIRAYAADFYNAGYAMGEEANQGLQDAWDEHSPSEVARRAGSYFGQGAVLGIESEFGAAESAGGSFGDAITSALMSALAQVQMLANEDFALHPQISPVIDMSSVSNAAASMNGMFGDARASVEFTSGIAAQMARIERAASDVQASQQTINNGDVITFNIYASEGMDENALADAVLNKMADRMGRRVAAFG